MCVPGAKSGPPLYGTFHLDRRPRRLGTFVPVDRLLGPARHRFFAAGVSRPRHHGWTFTDIAVTDGPPPPAGTNRPTPPDPAPREARDQGAPGASTKEHAIEFLLGVPPEESYDRMARVVAASLQAPMAIVTVSEMGRQVVRGCVGVAGRARAWRTVPDARLLVQRALLEARTLVIDAEHASGVREVRRASQAECAPHVIAVAPFVCRDRRTTGAICVADPNLARVWTSEDQLLLNDLAGAMCTELDLRREPRCRRRCRSCGHR